MSNKKIRQAVKWANSRCKDQKCIATEGHTGPHRDLRTEWAREEEEDEDTH